MGRKVSLESWEVWRERLHRQAASGLSIARFCENESIAVNGFYAWKRRLKEAGEGSASTVGPRSGAGPINGQAARPPRSVPQRSFRPSNQPVSAGTFFQVPMPIGHEPRNVDFQLVDGTVVRVPGNNFGAIELVLKTLAYDSQRSISGGGHHA